MIQFWRLCTGILFLGPSSLRVTRLYGSFMASADDERQTRNARARDGGHIGSLLVTQRTQRPCYGSDYGGIPRAGNPCLGGAQNAIWRKVLLMDWQDGIHQRLDLWWVGSVPCYVAANNFSWLARGGASFTTHTQHAARDGGRSVGATSPCRRYQTCGCTRRVPTPTLIQGRTLSVRPVVCRSQPTGQRRNFRTPVLAATSGSTWFRQQCRIEIGRTRGRRGHVTPPAQATRVLSDLTVELTLADCADRTRSYLLRAWSLSPTTYPSRSSSSYIIFAGGGFCSLSPGWLACCCLASALLAPSAAWSCGGPCG